MFDNDLLIFNFINSTNSMFCKQNESVSFLRCGVDDKLVHQQ